MLTSEELDHLDKSIHCLRLELPKAVADDALPPLHRLVQEHRESLSRRAPDDGEAITDEWLATIGMTSLSTGRKNSIVAWRTTHNFQSLRLSLTRSAPGWKASLQKHAYSFCLGVFTTRGQLRRLLEAIGGAK